METIRKEFTSLSEAIKFVRILKRYSKIVKMKSKGNVYIYSYDYNNRFFLNNNN